MQLNITSRAFETTNLGLVYDSLKVTSFPYENKLSCTDIKQQN